MRNHNNEPPTELDTVGDSLYKGKFRLSIEFFLDLFKNKIVVFF